MADLMVTLEVRPALDRWLLVMVDRAVVTLDARHPAMRYPLTRVVGCYETREAAEAAAHDNRGTQMTLSTNPSHNGAPQ